MVFMFVLNPVLNFNFRTEERTASDMSKKQSLPLGKKPSHQVWEYLATNNYLYCSECPTLKRGPRDLLWKTKEKLTQGHWVKCHWLGRIWREPLRQVKKHQITASSLSGNQTSKAVIIKDFSRWKLQPAQFLGCHPYAIQHCLVIRMSDLYVTDLLAVCRMSSFLINSLINSFSYRSKCVSMIIEESTSEIDIASRCRERGRKSSCIGINLKPNPESFLFLTNFPWKLFDL